MSGGAAIEPGSGTRVLTPSRRKYILFALFGLFILLFGMAFALTGDWYGWPVVALGLVVGGSCLLMLSPRFASLTLTPEGFTVRSGFTRRTWRWEAVGDFFPAYVNQSRAVGFDYADQAGLSGFKSKVGEIRGYDEYLPETYRLDVNGLAALMNAWRRLATAGT